MYVVAQFNTITKIAYGGIAFIPALLYLFLFLSYVQVIKDKINTITGLLTRPEALQHYVNTYGTEDGDIKQIAYRILRRNNYAILSYVEALVFTCFVTTLASAVAIARAGLPISLPNGLIGFLRTSSAIPAVLSGCAGAFIWGLYELLRRFQIGDLTPSAIYFAGIRLIVLAGVGATLSTVLKMEFRELTWAVAFGLGVMPLPTIAEVAAEPVRRALKLPTPTPAVLDASIPSLQGLTPEMIERLNEARIYNIQQLAFIDPLRLLVRTNLDWKVILDLVDQAFLALYVGVKITELRSIGIRGAVELRAAKDNEPVKATIAAILGRTPADVNFLIDTFINDPTTEFILKLWG
jgi:hypothetical protein